MQARNGDNSLRIPAGKSEENPCLGIWTVRAGTDTTLEGSNFSLS